MKLNVWHMSLPGGQSFDEEPPVPGAVQNGSLFVEGGALEIPLWEIDVTLEELIGIIEAAGGEAEINCRDNDYPHPELILP